MSETETKPKITSEDRIYLSLGSNLSWNGFSPTNLIDAACNQLIENGLALVARSHIFQSKAWPIGTNAPDYVNIAIEINSFKGSPFELLGIINEIETKFGRNRNANNQWAPRSIDIDIIDFKGIILDEIKDNKHLILPHPRAHLRDFVLLPLKEIAPNWMHPQSKQNISALISELPQNNAASA